MNSDGGRFKDFLGGRFNFALATANRVEAAVSSSMRMDIFKSDEIVKNPLEEPCLIKWSEKM